jgi:hypothetical protein
VGSQRQRAAESCRNECGKDVAMSFSYAESNIKLIKKYIICKGYVMTPLLSIPRCHLGLHM